MFIKQTAHTNTIRQDLAQPCRTPSRSRRQLYLGFKHYSYNFKVHAENRYRGLTLDSINRKCMNLNPQRPWITPLVIGTFVLMAVTGSLMFFHLDTGLNKTAHEWLGWAMVAAVLLHLLLNMNAFKRYFTQTTGRWVMLASAAVLALSFVPLGDGGGK